MNGAPYTPPFFPPSAPPYPSPTPALIPSPRSPRYSRGAAHPIFEGRPLPLGSGRPPLHVSTQTPALAPNFHRHTCGCCRGVTTQRAGSGTEGCQGAGGAELCGQKASTVAASDEGKMCPAAASSRLVQTCTWMVVLHEPKPSSDARTRFIVLQRIGNTASACCVAVPMHTAHRDDCSLGARA